MRRLTLIGRSRFDAVVRPDRNVEFLLDVAVEITGEQPDGTVRVVIPSVVRPGDARTAVADRVRQWKGARRLSHPLLSGVNEHGAGDRHDCEHARNDCSFPYHAS